jgi:hypothetical protein
VNILSYRPGKACDLPNLAIALSLPAKGANSSTKGVFQFLLGLRSLRMAREKIFEISESESDCSIIAR